MKCTSCNEGALEKCKEKYIVEIPKGPSLVIPNIEMRICSKCKDRIVDGATSKLIDKIALAALVVRYLPREKKMSASVGDWIRKTVDLSVAEISAIVAQNESTYYQATRRGSELDSMAKFFILLKAAQFVVGVDFSQYIVNTFNEVNKAATKESKGVAFIEREAVL